MSFDRNKAQLHCESLLGCSTFSDFFNANFESLVLNKNDAYLFSNLLKEDASDLYYKSCISLLEGLKGIAERNYSWAVVKLYYSCFYAIRADLGIKDYGLIRHKSIYYLEARDGASPITKGKTGSNRVNYSGDHKSTLNYYKDLFSNSDILSSQNIEGLSAYEWLMKKRERVHYQERYFNEPNYPNFLSFIETQISTNKFQELINEILSDNTYIKTFQPEFATLAIPIKRVLQTKKSFDDSSISINLTQKQKNHLKSYGMLDLL